MQIAEQNWTDTQDDTRSLNLEHSGLVLHGSLCCEDTDQWTWRVAIWRKEDGPRTLLVQAQSRDVFPEMEALSRATSAAQQIVQLAELTLAFDAQRNRW